MIVQGVHEKVWGEEFRIKVNALFEKNERLACEKFLAGFCSINDGRHTIKYKLKHIFGTHVLTLFKRHEDLDLLYSLSSSALGRGKYHKNNQQTRHV